MNDKELNDLKIFYQIRGGSKCVDFFSRYPLGEEWEMNLKMNLERVIFSDTTPIEKIHAIHEANVFNIHNKNEELKKIELEWWKEYLQREFKVNLKDLDPRYQDTKTTSQKAQIICHEKL